MGKVDKDGAAKAGDFLYRYMWARRRCVGATPPGNRLAQLSEWGRREFDGIDIEPDANPPTVRDSQYPAFFAAIIKQDDTATPGQADLAAWRGYVLNNGPLPKRPAAEPAFPIRMRQWEGLRNEPPPSRPSAAQKHPEGHRSKSPTSSTGTNRPAVE